MNTLAVWIAKYCLSKSNLTVDQRNQIITHILESIDALPLREIITVSDGGETLIAGRSIDMEKAKQLRESARLALDNVSLKVINEQVLYTAVTMGIHKVESPLQMLFARAAIWFEQQKELHLKMLAQRQEPDL